MDTPLLVALTILSGMAGMAGMAAMGDDTQEDWGIFRTQGANTSVKILLPYIGYTVYYIYLYMIIYIYAHTYTLSKSKHAVDGQKNSCRVDGRNPVAS